MDTNSNLEQINTFEGGMNTDTSDFLLDPKLYRYAENLRLLTGDGTNTGELRTIEGYTEIDKFNPEFKDSEGNDILNWIILKTDSIRNIGIIIAATLDRRQWGIWKIDGNDLGLKPVCIFGPCKEKDENGKDVPIGKNLSTVCRWETDKLVHLYIADGVHRTMAINLLHKDYENNLPPKDIKYLVAYSELLLPQLQTTLLKGGILKPAVIQYTYRLYKEGGLYTDWAPFTKPIYLYKNDTEGYLREETTDNAVKLNFTFSGNRQGLNKIQVYRITYISTSEDPEVYLIYDDNFNGSFLWVDDGSNIIQDTTYNFKQTEAADKFIPKILESKGDYLFSANIKDMLDEVDKLYEGINFAHGAGWVSLTWDYAPGYDISVQGKIYTKGGQEYTASLMPGETYRYGIILYDEKGRRSSVKWVRDLEIPESNTGYLKINGATNYLLDNASKEYDACYTAKPICAKVTILKNIPHCSAYEIVRCIREPQYSNTLFLGISGFAYGRGALAQVPQLLSRAKFFNRRDNVEAQTITNLLLFSCPEYTYLPEYTKDILNNGNFTIRNIYTFLPFSSIITKEYNKAYDRAEYTSYIGRGLFAYGNPLEIRYLSYNANSDEEEYTFLDVIGENSITDRIVGKIHSFYLGLIYPEHFVNYNLDIYSCNVDKFCFVDSSRPSDSILNENKLFVGENIVNIGEYNYYNYSKIITYTDKAGVFNYNYEKGAPIYFDSGGKFIICNISKGNALVSTAFPAIDIDDCFDRSTLLITDPDRKIEHCGDICITNILNKYKINYPAKNISVYHSFGNYFKYGFDLHNIYDGDVYINSFIFNFNHATYQPFEHQIHLNIVYSVPIFSRINLKAKVGNIYPNIEGNIKWFLDYSGAIANYTQNKDAYLYNTGYNSIVGVNSYTPVYRTEAYDDTFDVRIKYAGPKSNGETFDSWLMSLSSDTMDVDTRYGQITDLKLFKDKLIFWQERATGVISSNERTMLQDSDNKEILLGTGGVLQRYDYITTEYGMRLGDFSSVLSNTTLYWWDKYKKEIIGYSGGSEILPMSKVKNISSHIENNSNYENYATLFKPVLMYNKRYDEVLFKVVPGGTIVYNELILRFTSIYTLGLDHFIKFNDCNIIINKKTLYKWDNYDYNLKSRIIYIVNKHNTIAKTYDNVILGLNKSFNPYNKNNLYKNEDTLYNSNMKRLSFTFDTLGQVSTENVNITAREYDYRFAIPRAGVSANNWKRPEYGGRMRGKTMLCTLVIDGGYTQFAIQYINTKFRLSYS